MVIHGYNKTTLLDYPEHVACTVFTGHCNMRCPFCHNGDLVLMPGSQPTVPEEEFFAFLNKRKNILEGVAITGGEPTLQKDLPEFIERIKDLGLLVKLDSNGMKPEVLRSLIEKGTWMIIWRWILSRIRRITEKPSVFRIWTWDLLKRAWLF